MQSSKPALDVWDSCCLIGILNDEKDKLPALLAQTCFFETGAAMLGLPIAVLDEVVTLSDGTSAQEKVKAFLLNPYVLPLHPNLEVSFKSKSLRIRFDSKRMPEPSGENRCMGFSVGTARTVFKKPLFYWEKWRARLLDLPRIAEVHRLGCLPRTQKFLHDKANSCRHRRSKQGHQDRPQ